jgi:hypothetical protein
VLSSRLLYRLPIVGPLVEFRSNSYIRHNQRRLEHLASLNLPISGKTVLELGAGIGDHTSFFLDRGCAVTAVEARPRNVALLRRQFGNRIKIVTADVMELAAHNIPPAQVVHCYGLLYHLSRPLEAIGWIADHCSELCLLETCVSFGDESAVNLVSEIKASPTQAADGTGCRPTRRWVVGALKQFFPHVYVTVTQPCHEQFPTDWQSSGSGGLARAVFVASRIALSNALLTSEIPSRQTR